MFDELLYQIMQEDLSRSFNSNPISGFCKSINQSQFRENRFKIKYLESYDS